MNLWNFALTLYARPGVEVACLEAQQAGADVCLLLCGAWLDGHDSPYQPATGARLRRLAEERQTALIRPLRLLRQQLREPALRAPQIAQLRERIRELELSAERQLLEQLEALCKEEALCESAQREEGAERRPSCTPLWLTALAAPLAAGHPALALIDSQRLAFAGNPAAD